MLKQIMAGKNLTEIEAEQLMNRIMSGELTENQISGHLVALAMKGETVEEITGFARAMRSKSTKIPVKLEPDEILFDGCGTGGSGSGVFNISTLVAIITAAAGVKVAKHGNRGASSKCGSADILENLGVPLFSDVDKVADSIDKTGIGFLFAPFLHKAMKYAIQPRRELGIRTVFNILGPLTNPASATHQLLGVFDPDLTEPIAKVLGKLGVKRAMVVHGDGHMDEVSTVGKTKVSELKNGEVNTFYIIPEDFGIKRVDLEKVQGGSIEKNVQIAKDVLSGKNSPALDIVLLNAAFALYTTEKSSSILDGVKQAGEIIDSGKALQKLEEMKGFGA